MFDPKLLRQEVEELTELLRRDDRWADLKLALNSKGFSADEVVLAGLMEDEGGNEFGVIITHQLRVIEYSRKTSGRSAKFTLWRVVRNPKELLDKFPAVEVGLGMVRARYHSGAP